MPHRARAPKAGWAPVRWCCVVLAFFGVTAPNECLDALRQRLSDGVDVFGDVVSGRPRFCADLTRAIYFDIR